MLLLLDMNAATTPILREDVIRLLGDVDDLVVAQLVSSGASVAELEEAVSELEFELEKDDQPIESSRPRVRALRALLGDLLADELTDDESPPAPAR